jgi:hypothetical protein
MRHVGNSCIALTFAPLDFGAVVVLRLAWL